MKRLFYGFLILFLIFLPVTGGSAQDRGISLQQAAGLDSAVGRQWAVFIAINRYKEWPPLTNPVRDAKEIKEILREDFYIDEVRELYDDLATAAGIRQLLVNLRSQVGKDDSVFVFYAGHGHTDLNTNTGSWIPTDGGRDEMAQTNWLPNIQVRNMLSQLPAKHVFWISDSCFSGDILDTSRGAAPQISSDYYKRAYSRVSRQVMTSGASESVPDASEFAMRLKNGLRRAEGACIDPEYLFSTAGVREVKSTQPLLGVIRGSEHQDGGSFLFFKKQAQTASAQTPASNQPVAVVSAPALSASIVVGDINVTSEIAGIVMIDGVEIGSRIKAGGSITVTNVSAGSTDVAVKDDDGKITKAPAVMVRQGQTASVVIGMLVPETSAVTDAPTVPSSLSHSSDEDILSLSGWRVKNDRDSSSTMSMGKERIDGRERDVLTVNINLATGSPRWAGVDLLNMSIIEKLKNANGLRFKVLGDGKRWRVHFATSNVTDSAFHGVTISTQNGKVSSIDVPFNKLGQPDWGKKVAFNKNNLIKMAIERQYDMGGAGKSTIKIFDFEVY
jgi:biotin carboxyl carrier protein